MVGAAVFDEGDAIGRGISAAMAAPAHGGGFEAAGGKLVGIEKAVEDLLAVGRSVLEGFDLGVDPGLAGGGLAEAITETVFFEGGEADAGFFCGFAADTRGETCAGFAHWEPR